ncbi:ShlB/FhaC/HecB family hemolysin secretion/activation protein [Mesorhizobium sp. NZP2077]|uniref:ShlB/FhaC/HecB family hemolysin secretion/activation protein n=1 Tax=Mesorhizobium sp. NZP2077 TaxID=2483404 RepID=UPI0015539E4B|nr:ShlB/FhaC/HecB family hemolysin secretion/activation protein [Mesorhizobium sp. NZP2077]QKC82020.1 ShlB/FhaC/HecB family hemolysin secretion/activation protein [Mesorhizobium sp. NZP2077]QKD15493.1 ShlB/FhaC/HecB family hemolysin secretion/activation protein [Mesorhizobium sp. NZP2077]
MLAASICLGLPAGAFAETASQITPPSFRPPPQTNMAGVTIPEGSGLEAPAGAEKLKVKLRDVSVEGGLPDMAEATRKIVAGIAHRTVTAAEIFAAARALETAYGRAGYALVRVVLPAQKLNDGARLSLVVIDGYLERIDTSNLPERIRGRVEATLAPLVGQKSIKLSAIERKLLLAGDMPGARLRSTLQAGTAKGASVLVIDGKYRPLGGQVTVDNSLSPSLQRWSTGVGVDFNSLLGLGELVYVRIGGYPDGGESGLFTDAPRNRNYAAGIVVPIGYDGLTLNLEATRTRANPAAEPGTLGFGSEFERYSARLRYPWIRSRELTVRSELSFDAQNDFLNAATPISLPIAEDRLRIIRFGTDATWFTSLGGVFTGNVVASFGIDGLGARSAADATPLLPLSRQGADADFQKLEVQASYSQPLATHLGLDLYARAQTSFGKPLLQSEQIGLVGANSLSSFDAGALQGDSGYVLRGELSSPWYVPFTGGIVSLSPYVFGAIGQVHLEMPTVLETADIVGASYGLGLKVGTALAGDATNASLTLEWGRQHRDDHLPTSDRFSLAGAIQF